MTSNNDPYISGAALARNDALWPKDDEAPTPKCDICGEPDGPGTPDWNGETGNHASCEHNDPTIRDWLAEHHPELEL